MSPSVAEYPYIDCKDNDSFAYFTLVQRFPRILQQIIDHNSWLTTEQQTSLQHLGSNITTSVVKKINTISAEDEALWHEFYQQYENKNYLDVPFFFLEAYFYKLILHITDFKTNYKDPFLPIKNIDLSNSTTGIQNNNEKLLSILSEPDKLESFILQALRGNSVDLSQLATLEESNNNSILIPLDIKTIQQHVIAPNSGINIYLDNAFTELWYDLVLALHLVEAHKISSVQLVAKPYPIFVSDATPSDIKLLLDIFSQSEHAETQQLALLMKKNIADIKIQITTDHVLNGPLHFTNELKNSSTPGSLNIFKGDANYRRLFEDRTIPETIDTTSIMPQHLKPALLLRVLKSEIICGLTPQLVEKLEEESKHWRTDASRAIAQVLV